MTVLTPANAFPGIPAPQHGAGLYASQSFVYPGAVRPNQGSPSVLSYTNAFPGIPFPNKGSGLSKPQSYIYPGAVQPQSSPFLTIIAIITAFVTVHEP